MLIKMNILCLTAILVTFFTQISFSKTINTFIPKNCERLQYNQNLNVEDLTERGNTSALVVIAYLHEGLVLRENTECWIIVRAPINNGIVTTVKKISFHDNDTLVFQGTSNNKDVFLQKDQDYKYTEILSLPKADEKSSIRMRFSPSINRSQHMAGFELTFTSYRVKVGDTCGDDFDCDNERCISPDFQCDGYDNCGNDRDEAGCAGISLWIIILLVIIGILVVVLAITLWYRMAQR